MQKWGSTSTTLIPPSTPTTRARLRFRCLPISINSKPSMEITGLLESRLILLRNVVCRLSTHDRCEEYCMLQVSPLARDWGITLKEDEEQHGLP